MFSVFINGLERTLSELVDHTRLGANSWYTGGHSSIQRDLHELLPVLCCDVHFGADGLTFLCCLGCSFLLGSTSGSPLSLTMFETSFPSQSKQLKGLC